MICKLCGSIMQVEPTEGKLVRCTNPICSASLHEYLIEYYEGMSEREIYEDIIKNLMETVRGLMWVNLTTKVFRNI